ncbi:MAG: 2-amino-4-hydroxy-6-hydroxymethyldihydropteridine diphosphokinase [Prevotellaceae bacterium]|jgi:2-amino-4-hydroxy-6-hydroxymethyldihydropteridine diphosphokinase|nr:2-amino-4-hydroxy-6-hydroxymethyldihydropteridine diphosphokinase [Prevotellaceae bacterium]
MKNGGTTKSNVYLLTGSNLGDRKSYLDNAKTGLSASIGALLAESSIYESSPWGFAADGWFLNQVLLYETVLTPYEILHALKLIESANGRVRSGNGYTSRNLDIDILFYDDAVLNHADLTVPHPMLHKRRFTLMPLNEIAPNLVHPVLGLNVGQMLENTGYDKTNVKLWNVVT